MELIDLLGKQSTPIKAGLLAPIIALTGIKAAILISPWFSWMGNALSDLGYYNNGLPAAIIFNLGLVATGILMLVFTSWFIEKSIDISTRIGMFIFAISNVFLVLVGIFSENFGFTHFVVSVGFFATFPFAMWIIGISWLRFKPLRWFSLVSILLPFMSVYFWYVTFGGPAPWSGVAIPEIVTALTAILWHWTICGFYVKGMLPMLERSGEQE